MNGFMRKIMCSVGLLAAVISAHPAMADITAAELLAEWKEDVIFMEMDMTIGSEEMNGDTLTLTDVTYFMEMPQGSMEVFESWATIREIGDGSLEMLVSPSITIKMNSNDGHDGIFDILVDVELEDATSRITGTQKDHTYDFSVGNMAINYTIDAPNIPDDFTFSIKFINSETQFHQVTTVWEDAFYEGDFIVEKALARLAFSLPDEDVQIEFQADISNISSTMQQDISPYLDFIAMVEHGVTASSILNMGEAAISFSGVGPDLNIAFDGGFTSGQITSGITDTSLELSSTRSGSFMNLHLPDFGISTALITMDSADFQFHFPADHSGAISDVEFGSGFSGLTIDEKLWSIVDPEQAISRAPMSFALTLIAQIKMFRNIFDPEFDQFSDELIGEIVSLNVKELSADMAGVLFNAVADVEFNYGDKTSFDGFPQPIGTASFDLKGAFGLIGNLITAGILPPMEAFGIKAGIGTIAVAGDDEDHFVSDIEFTKDAHILVNSVQFD